VARFATYVRDWLTTNLDPLDDLNLGLEEWLADTSYTNGQKENIRQKFHTDPAECFRRKRTACGSFKKRETYSEMKFLRAINARQDYYKAAFGPLIKQIEKQLYRNRAFIKHIPSRERARYIRDVLDSENPVIVEGDDGIFRIGDKIYMTDFSSFEALFTETFVNATEKPLFRHMLSRFQEYAERLLALLESVAHARNTTVFTTRSKVDAKLRKLLKIVVWFKRMSGEMWTSAGNGFANLMVITFARQCAAQGEEINVEWFAKLGLICKLQVCDTLEDATFCGLIFDDVSYQAIVDPRTALLKFSWMPEKYIHASRRVHMHLLRSKAMSLAYEVPNCPILAVFAKRVLELCQGCRPETALKYAESRWYKERLLTEIEHGNVQIGQPTGSTRFLFEKRFGISVADQLRAELLLENMSLGPIPDEVVEILQFPNINYVLWDEYVTRTPDDRDGFVNKPHWHELTILKEDHAKSAREFHRERRRDAKRRPQVGTYYPPQ